MTELIVKSLKTAAALLSKGGDEESQLICRQILKVDPDNYGAMCLLSCCLKSEAEESEKLKAKADELAGNDSEAHNFMGLSCMHARETERAIDYFEKAALLDPKNENPIFNKASCLMLLGLHDEALGLFEQARKISNSSRSAVGMAAAMTEMSDFDGAMSLLLSVIKSDPENLEAKTNISTVLHLAGRWDEAWSYYPSRLMHYELIKKSIESMGIPLWTEGPPPKGRILVFSEQGVGDSINFGRIALKLQSMYPDRYVATFVAPQLRPLLRSQGINIAEGTDGFDACCSMMDLPGLLHLSRDEVKDSFVKIKPTKMCDMSRFMGLFKIGVCWAGNPAHPKDYQRSFSMDMFRGVHDIEGVKLFSLQKDTRPRMWPQSREPVDLSAAQGMKLVDMSPYMNSWEDTVSIISALDLVISADTSVMHASAALGKETWAVIQHVPDWRWGMDSEYSCWYPNLRLFRQERPGDWQGVFSAVRGELIKKLHSD